VKSVPIYFFAEELIIKHRSYLGASKAISLAFRHRSLHCFARSLGIQVVRLSGQLLHWMKQLAAMAKVHALHAKQRLQGKTHYYCQLPKVSFELMEHLGLKFIVADVGPASFSESSYF
jgi:hypothetical protein